MNKYLFQLEYDIPQKLTYLTTTSSRNKTRQDYLVTGNFYESNAKSNIGLEKEQNTLQFQHNLSRLYMYCALFKH